MSIDRKAGAIWASLLVGLGIFALSSGGCEETKAPPAAPVRGCNGGAFIVKMEPNVPCPITGMLSPADEAKPHWEVKAICGGTPEHPIPQEKLPLQLQGFCSWTWNDGQGSSLGAPDAKELREMPHVLSVEEDCVTSGMQGDAEGGLTQSAYVQMNQSLRQAAGVSFDAAKLPLAPSPQQVFVSALDSLPHEKVAGAFGGQPNGAPDPFLFGNDDHGWTVLALIDSLTTYTIDPAPSPPKKLVLPDAQLALPGIDYDTIDVTNGGYFGRQFHLANAICSAIDEWEKGHDPAASPAPVITMALGALPLEGQQCDSAEAIEAAGFPTRVVYYAMKHAACHGAAIVAAAGNDSNGALTIPGCNEVSGPTCPGGMAKIPAPTPSECQDLYNDTNPPVYDATKYKIYGNGPLEHPLVYMISGVEATGKLLSTTRDGGRSKLAAIGQLGTAQDLNQVWHAARTGTSISTAVAAAAFATLFAFKPGLTAAEAANKLYESALATPVGQVSDIDGQPVRMISICNALEKAGIAQLGCPTAPESNASVVVADESIFTKVEQLVPPLIQLPMSPLGTSETPISSAECPADSPMNSETPGSTRCRPNCGYLFADPGDSIEKGRAIIQLDGGNEVAFSHLTLVLHSKANVDEVFVLNNFGFSPESRLMLTNIESKIPESDLRSASFEALMESDGSSSVVHGEIPIFKNAPPPPPPPP